MSSIVRGQPPRVFSPPQPGQTILTGDRNYFLGPSIGSGHFGAVYGCTDDWGNDLVAKVLLPRGRPYEEIRDCWIAELQKLLTLRHPNITFAYDAFEFKDTFYLVLERCSTTLAGLMQTPGFDGSVWLPFVARDLLQGVHFIHGAGYVHKDLHEGNVFLAFQRDRMVPQKDPVLSFKIGDLGISRLESEINVFTTLLAEWMLPPEFLNPSEFGVVGRGVDVYHSALLLLRLLVGSSCQFSREEVLQGKPRQMAESLTSKFSGPLSRALRRHTASRTPSAMQFWLEIRKEEFLY